MWPSWVDLIFLLHTGLRELEVGLLDIWERSENVFLNHGHHIVKVRNDQTYHCLLILKHLLDFVDSVEAFCFALYIL